MIFLFLMKIPLPLAADGHFTVAKCPARHSAGANPRLASASGGIFR